MLIASLFVLSAVIVNGLAESQHGTRRTRQLDLQDIQPQKEELGGNDQVVNGYLPPASPSSVQPTVVSAQSQQSFEFKPVNSLEEESKPCKPPFDHVSCNFKSSATSESKIAKPSRDLVPPFNDLEQEKVLPTIGAFEQEEKTETATEIQSEFITTTEKVKTTETTEKLVTKASEQVATRVASKNFPPAPSTAAFPNKAEATNELRSYIPPRSEFSAAAQTNVAVVQPASPNNDHQHQHGHHHGHHHGENFNICADAFHSFLCAPLKARKRITGAFPSSLRGQSSFINYQKLLPNFEREPAPSNTLQNAYLPPKTLSSSTNLIHSTHAPPTTRRPIVTTARKLPSRPPPKVIPEPSNSDDRFYLPPVSENRLSAPSTVPAPTLAPTPRPTPSPITNPPFGSHPPAFNFLPSNENRLYLPPSPNPQPAPSFISTARNIYPVTPTVSPQPTVLGVSLPTITTFAPFPSNSLFITHKPRPQPTFSFSTTTTKPSTAKLQPVTSSPFVPLNSVSYDPKTPRPLVSTKNPHSSFNFAEQSSNEDRSYLPPDTNLAAAAQTNAAAAAVAPKNPFHHGRDLCTDPFHSFLCASAKPRKRITGQLPSGVRPDSSNANEARLRPVSAGEEEDKVPLEGASAQNVGYKYPRPSSSLPPFSNSPPSSTVSSHPTPDTIFPLQSQQNVQLAEVAASSTTTRPELRPSEARVSGYEYPKPDKIFPLPAEQTKAASTTIAPTTGYSYPKPQKPFPLPTVQKPKQKPPPPKGDVASPTTQVKGYQYPKPDQSLKLPEKSGGYSYPKPGKRLELPTESRFRLPSASPNLDPVGSLGSAEFIPVNKLDFKRSESKLVAGLRRFGERHKKRLREASITKKQGE